MISVLLVARTARWVGLCVLLTNRLSRCLLGVTLWTNSAMLLLGHRKMFGCRKCVAMPLVTLVRWLVSWVCVTGITLRISVVITSLITMLKTSIGCVSCYGDSFVVRTVISLDLLVSWPALQVAVVNVVIGSISETISGSARVANLSMISVDRLLRTSRLKSRIVWPT